MTNMNNIQSDQETKCVLMNLSTANSAMIDQSVIEYSKSIIKSLQRYDIVYLLKKDENQKGSIVGMGCLEFIFPLEILSNKSIEYLYEKYQNLIIRYAMDFKEGFNYPATIGYVKDVMSDMISHYQNQLQTANLDEQDNTYAILINNIVKLDLPLDQFTYVDNRPINPLSIKMCYIKRNATMYEKYLNSLLPSTSSYEENKTTERLICKECNDLHQILDHIELWLYIAKDNPYIDELIKMRLFKRINAIAQYVSN